MRTTLPVALVAVVLLAGCRDTTGVTVAPNLGPQILITAPVIEVGEDAVIVEIGQGLQLSAVVSDAEDDVEELVVSWSATATDVVLDPIALGTSEPDSDGYMDFVVGGLDAGSWRVEGRVTDTNGATATASLPVVILAPDDAPEVAITQPGPGQTFLRGELVTFSAVASDDRGAEGLTVEWLSDRMGVLNNAPASSSGLLIFSRDDLVLGEHNVSVRVRDVSGNTDEATVSLTIEAADLPPSTAVVDVTPASPDTTDSLTCLVLIGSVDPEGQPVTYSFSWLRDGNPMGLTGATLPASETARGDVWTCSVTASDGGLQSVPATADVTVINAAPSANSATISPATAYETSTLACVGAGFSDPDGDGAGWVYAWTVDGSPAGATATLDGASFDKGQAVQCSASPTDGIDVGPAVLSSSLTISNSPPGAAVIEVSPSPSAEVADALDCAVLAAPTDADGDVLADEVQWQIDGLHAPVWNGSWTIPAGEAALGEEWTCAVRATDGQDNGPWTSATTRVGPLVGDLVISELMIDPLAVSDAAGEWVEIHNPRPHDLDLLGFTLHDDGSDSYTFVASLPVPAGGYVVVGRNEDLLSNGGASLDREISAFILDNTADEVVLSFDGLEIDRVEYYLNGTWLGGRVGSAWALDPDLGQPSATDNDDPASWCRSALPQAGLGTDFGTPGGANDPCPCGSSDKDEDGFGIDVVCAWFDCDDNDVAVNPAAFDVCEDGVDSDCAGGDALCACTITDDDGDGYGDGDTCSPVDCNDNDITVSPGATEVCNGVDEDCDGVVDDGFDVDGDGYTTCAGDCADGDPARNPAAIEVCNGVDDDCDALPDDGFDLDSDGFTTCAGDCDDTRPLVHDGATESCDSRDSNCDGSLVDGFPDFDADGIPDCVDTDDDNDGDPDAADCADLDAAVFHGATELCDNVDSDCDGSLVDAFADFDTDGLPDCVDPDDDGDGNPDAADCNDANPAIYVGAPENCDGIDSDCDGSLIDGFANWDGDAEPDCVDENDDNDPDPDASDCNDNDPAVYTGAPETCDYVDSDCDGSLVDGFSDLDGDGSPDCIDNDNDGDGESGATDCDDADATVYTGAPESCDGRDSDCDGSLVDSFPNADGDFEPDCIDDNDDNDPSPDVSDCAPTNPAVYPGATELCDGIDSDCDGSLVDSFANWDGDTEPDCVDADDDNDGDPDSTDCADTNPARYTGATETCNGIDDDCDTLVDDGFDGDGDGFTSCAGDCNNSNPNVYPGRADTCDGIDNDCDSAIDEDAPGDAWEPNNSITSAAYIGGDNSDVSLTGLFQSTADNEDWYSISTTDDWLSDQGSGIDDFRIQIWLSSIPNGADYDVWLYGPDGTALAVSQEVGNTTEHIDWWVLPISYLDDGGTYYIRVLRFSGSSCSDTYQLRVINSD